MYLEAITGKSELENRELEFKLKLDRDNAESWLKTVAGFANAGGGVFYIGVEDGTGRLVGFPRDKADAERNFFNNQVNEHLTPRPSYTIEFPRFQVRDRELFLLKITVPESPVKPVVVRYRNIPSIYMRREGYTNGATYEEIIAMSIKSQHASYDTLSSGIHYNSEDFSTLRDYYRGHNDGKPLSEKLLESMGFFDSDKILANGAVLFKDHYDGDRTAVQCSVFSGFSKGSERIVTINKFSGNIPEIISYMMEFVMQRMNHSMIKRDDTRINIDAYPQRALFEGIVNSVAHRDYFMNGTQIQLDMFRDRLEISSPGNFYQKGRMEKTYDLSHIISKRRNELICNILVHCNVMEAAGTGFDKIAEEYSSADDAHKPYIFSSSDQFTLVLPDLTYSAGVSESDFPALEFVPVSGGTEHDAAVLSYCYHASRRAAEIADFLGLSNSTYLRQNILANLVSQGYLEQVKVSRTTYYRTNHDMVKQI